MKKPVNEFLKGQKITAVEEFSKELIHDENTTASISESYEILSPEDTEAKNRHHKAGNS